MMLKSFDEMNPEQQFAYKMGQYDLLPDGCIWILGRDVPSGWFIDGLYTTKEKAIENAVPGQFVARFPLDQWVYGIGSLLDLEQVG